MIADIAEGSSICARPPWATLLSNVDKLVKQLRVIVSIPSGRLFCRVVASVPVVRVLAVYFVYVSGSSRVTNYHVNGPWIRARNIYG